MDSESYGFGFVISKLKEHNIAIAPETQEVLKEYQFLTESEIKEKEKTILKLIKNRDDRKTIKCVLGGWFERQHDKKLSFFNAETSVLLKEHDQETEKIKRTPYFFDKENNILYEQVIGEKFVCFKDGEFQEVTKIEGDLDVWHPQIGEELTPQKPIVYLPEKPEEYGDLVKLREDVQNFINKYCDVTPSYEYLASWYVLMTWIYEPCLDTVAYLRLMGDLGTGKSRLVETVGYICYRPINVSGASTTSAVKRLLDKWRGTLIFDEGDVKQSDETNELVKMFNLGFERRKPMCNCNKNDSNLLEFYNPFCPKIISTRRPFWDQALESRCLTEITRATARTNIPKKFLPACFWEEQKVLRNKLLRFRFDYISKIDLEKAINLDIGCIEPRLEQATSCFLPLLVADGVALTRFKEFVGKYNLQLIENRTDTLEGKILGVLMDKLAEYKPDVKSVSIGPKDIASVLNDERAPDDKIPASTIGKHLRTLGIKTTLKRTGEDKKPKRIIELTPSLIPLFKRYSVDFEKIEEAEKVCNSVTDVTDVSDIEGKKKQQKLTSDNAGGDKKE